MNIKTGSTQKEWFCGRDVCEILGLENIKDVLLKQVKQLYRTGLKSLGLACAFHANPVSHHAGKQYLFQNLAYVNFSSCLEATERFRPLVFEEVLPSIRKTGGCELQTMKMN